MTIQSNDTFVRHRFIGHRDLGQDGEGIAALSWLLDEEDNMKLFVRNADTIILNSAAHDCLRNERTPRPDWVGEFSQTLNQSIEKIRSLNPNARVWYKGSNMATLMGAGCDQLDIAARSVAAQMGVGFLDATRMTRPLYGAIPELITFGVHVGGIHVYSCQNVNASCGGLLANLQLHDVVSQLCA
jgi:hypothetical protein